MAKQVTVSFSAACGGDGIVQYTYNPPQSPITNQNAAEAVPVAAPLGSGATTIAVPATATYALIVPILNSVNPKTVKTTIGDTGISFTGLPVAFPVTGGASLFFTATAQDTVYIVWC